MATRTRKRTRVQMRPFNDLQSEVSDYRRWLRSARCAIAASKVDDGSLEQMAGDVIANLLHLVNSRSGDFERAIERGRDSFLEETDEPGSRKGRHI